MISFTVYGEPVAKGRPRFSRRGPHVVAYTPKKTKDAEEGFLEQAFKYRPEVPFDEPLIVNMTIHRLKPKSASNRIKWPVTRPDLDNYVKILDSLNGVFWRDDSIIVMLNAMKCFGEVAKTDIQIFRVADIELVELKHIQKGRSSKLPLFAK